MCLKWGCLSTISSAMAKFWQQVFPQIVPTISSSEFSSRRWWTGRRCSTGINIFSFGKIAITIAVIVHTRLVNTAHWFLTWRWTHKAVRCCKTPRHKSSISELAKLERNKPMLAWLARDNQEKVMQLTGSRGRKVWTTALGMWSQGDIEDAHWEFERS